MPIDGPDETRSLTTESGEAAGRGYPGGKAGAGVYQTIINQMPPHRLYVEPFVGGGAVLRRKRPALRSLALDLNEDARLTLRRCPDLPPNVDIRRSDGLRYLEDTAQDLDSGALLYLDPPYLMETRRSRRPLYAHEFDRADHERLLTAVTRLRCLVMVSGYWSELYAEALRGWRAVSFQAATRGRPAEEWLWMNFPEPRALHDYRYLGDDYRARERIKRKARRWAANLKRLPPLERQALLSALYQADEGITPAI